MGEKITKFPTPVLPPKLGKNANYKRCVFGEMFPLVFANFPRFRGLGRGGDFCNFSRIFLRDFRPGGFERGAGLLEAANANAPLGGGFGVPQLSLPWTFGGDPLEKER